MASPDISPYVSPTLVGKDPQDYVQGAFDAISTYTPEYAPREGDPDLELLGALALPAAEIGYHLDRVPDGWAETDAAFLGMTRREGTPATVTLTFTVTPDPLGVEIGAGFRASLDLGTGETVTFETDVAVVSAANASTVTAAATATTTGTDGNGIVGGTALIPQSAHNAVSAVHTSTTSGGGTDPEDDPSFLSRYAARKATQAATLVNAGQFTAYTVDVLGAYRVLTRDNWDVADGANGHVTVFVAKTGGAFYTTGEKAAMAADLDARAQANLIVHVANPVIDLVDVTVQVVAKPGYDEATVTDNIEAALAAYLSPDSWDWAGTVYVNELISVIDRAPGVERVVTGGLTAPAADVVLTGSAPLVQVDTVTVTFA